MKTECYCCHQLKFCSNLRDIGWICANCVGNYPPDAGTQRKIEREERGRAKGGETP